MRQEMVTYRGQLIESYKVAYGDEEGRYRYSTLELMDKADMELRYMWESTNG